MGGGVGVDRVGEEQKDTAPSYVTSEHAETQHICGTEFPKGKPLGPKSLKNFPCEMRSRDSHENTVGNTDFMTLADAHTTPMKKVPFESSFKKWENGSKHELRTSPEVLHLVKGTPSLSEPCCPVPLASAFLPLRGSSGDSGNRCDPRVQGLECALSSLSCPASSILFSLLPSASKVCKEIT